MAKVSKSTAKAKTKTKVEAEAQDADFAEEAHGNGVNLVIVESPAKANTIRKILGSNFQVKASVGHVRDLPKKKLGVTIEDNFSPVYEILAEKADIAEELK